MAPNLIEEMDCVALEFVLLDRSLRLMGSLGGRSRIPKGRFWTCGERSGLEVLTALLKIWFYDFSCCGLFDCCVEGENENLNILWSCYFLLTCSFWRRAGDAGFELFGKLLSPHVGLRCPYLNFI